MSWIKRLFANKPPSDARSESEAQSLEEQSEVQSLRLELAERDARIAALGKQADPGRSSARADSAAHDRIKRWLESAAAPASQLKTQAHLVQVEKKPVRARDVLAVARQLLRVLEDAGMAFEGEVGDVVAFDPDRHRPLGEASLSRGDRVRIRFVAVKLGERVIHKAGVAADRVAADRVAADRVAAEADRGGN